MGIITLPHTITVCVTEDDSSFVFLLSDGDGERVDECTVPVYVCETCLNNQLTDLLAANKVERALWKILIEDAVRQTKARELPTISFSFERIGESEKGSSNPVIN